MYYDPWRRFKVSERIALERAAAVRQIPDDLPSGWEHNEAGPRDPRDASRHFDPNDLTRRREDGVTPAPMSEVVHPELIEAPSSRASPVNASTPVETFPPQLAPDPYARQQVSRSNLRTHAPDTEWYAAQRREAVGSSSRPVSYTHLTLPTILLV